MTPKSLFAPGAPKVWTMPAGCGFLPAFAKTLADAADLQTDPAALADALIYVPNRRSARALALALFDAAGGAPILPPDIRALGDLESDDAPSGADEALAGLGPPLSDAARLGALAQLVSAYFRARGAPIPPGSALASAQELAALLDQAALTGGVDWTRLPDLVEETDLADHWLKSVEFLRIVSEHWPAWLEAEGASEPFARRLATAEAIAKSWSDRPPQGIVAVAGSTGATPATRALMAAAARLPKGLVLLPGLDRDADARAWSVIGDEPGHPQYALTKALEALGLAPDDVPVWPGLAESARADARRRLVHEALAPASETADWLSRLNTVAGGAAGVEQFASQAFDGLSLIEAADETEEAKCAALLLREALETQDRTAALVTPDTGLARRVSALLARWGVDAPPSAGDPIHRTPGASLIFLALDWALDPGDAARLCALLKHPLANIDADEARRLEMEHLRGPRIWKDWDGLAVKAQGYGAIARLSAAISKHGESFEEDRAVDGSTAMAALASLCDDIAGDTLWLGESGAAAAKLLEDASAILKDLGPVRPADLRGVLETLARGRSIPPAAGHPRIAIWGPLEARLQHADRLILAGLDEGLWPAQPPADAFLPRRFRKTLGLEAPEARMGLAAHDFAQLACAPDVVLLRAKRRDDAPTIASRWVWRLTTLARGALGDAADDALAPDGDPRIWARDMMRVEPDDVEAEPRPRPPLEARPARLSVTRIDQLQRDPYAVFAESVLQLKPLDPLNAPLGPRERGTAIHAALERFEVQALKTSEDLLSLLETELAAAGETDSAIRAARAGLRRTADWYLDWRRERMAHAGDVLTERPGRATFRIGGANFTLTAKADRIEVLPDGRIAIVDFKTGPPPSDKQIAVGLDQQMPLQALIAREGGFDGVPQAETAELAYVAFRSQPLARAVGGSKALPGDPPDLAEAARAGLFQLIEGFRDPMTAYLSAPRVQFRSKYAGDYERLARRAEWARDAFDE